jgi:hypothetical protein
VSLELLAVLVVGGVANLFILAFFCSKCLCKCGHGDAAIEEVRGEGVSAEDQEVGRSLRIAANDES